MNNDLFNLVDSTAAANKFFRKLFIGTFHKVVFSRGKGYEVNRWTNTFRYETFFTEWKNNFYGWHSNKREIIVAYFFFGIKACMTFINIMDQ